ncbi:lytic murein transglycosylase B [Marinicella litoralis]|uniref:Membrane-bound lytic murein transglycosylase B n=1 Tax=Marinicella litoralis TaxID=644220 RepID=A0A4R6XTF5_9GAMM|nr:lytic murein transglycosylase B [Marinicella litoralis]TDR20723.1 membrane-bound lytic murein transglycosylase B [Marinicella litoralis]
MKKTIFLLIIFFNPLAWAKVDLKKVDQFIQSVAAEIEVEPQWIRNILAQANHQQSIIDAMNRPAEKTLKWFEYRKIFITDKRAQEGVEFWEQHEAVLNEVSAQSGVPAEIIVAIIGVETFYGRIKGNHKVLDALYTLAFDYPKRSPFFTSELKHFLQLAQENHIDPLSAKGSYAGAMGFGQFMPSSYRAYAVDYESDQVIDLINNPQDAIASVANYLNKHKWQPGGQVLSTTEKPSVAMKFNQLKPHMKDHKTQEHYTVLELDLENGEKQYWQGFQNFYVISRYNHSHMYVSAVYELSQNIKALRAEGSAQ